MKNPVFAYGTYAKLESAVRSGKVKYPTYCWVHDSLQYAFVNKNGDIELVGLPKLTGTLKNEIILSELVDGVYLIKGQHRIAESSETVYLSASYIIAIVATDGLNKKVRRITVDQIEDYTVDPTGEPTKSDGYVTAQYLTDHHYVTDAYVDEKIVALEISLKTELREYVDAVVAEQVAALVPGEIDKYIGTVPSDDVSALFSD